MVNIRLCSVQNLVATVWPRPPLIIRLTIDANQIVVDDEISVGSPAYGIWPDRQDLLGHDANPEFGRAQIAEAIEAEPAWKRADIGDIRLEPRIRQAAIAAAAAAFERPRRGLERRSFSSASSRASASSSASRSGTGIW